MAFTSLYKNIFGTPTVGLHSVRFMNIAVIDVFATIFVAYLTSIYLETNFICTFILLFILGMVVHRILSIKTTVTVFFENNFF